MKDKLRDYFVSNVLPKTTVAYDVNIKTVKTYPMNGTTKVACDIYANFVFTPPCCADVEEREVLDNTFEFTLNNDGFITECSMVTRPAF